MGEKTAKGTDRRVLRTRRLLREALVTLILERGWDETSVQDVCDRADVGRSTFYTHFADKEELLTSGFGDFRRALRAQHPAPAAGRPVPPLAFSRTLLEHVQENRRMFRALVGKRSGLVVQRHFRELLLELVREDLAALIPSGVRLEAAAHYLAGAFFELVSWWLDMRGPLAPSEMDEHFRQLTAPVLASLQGTHGRGGAGRGLVASSPSAKPGG